MSVHEKARHPMQPTPVVGMRVMWHGSPADCGTVTEVDASLFSVRWDTVGFRRDHVIGGYELHGQDWSPREGAWPVDPAPAEPAKAAGWKNGDRFTVSGTVFDADYGVEWLRCVLDGHASSRPPIPRSCLRPEAAPGDTIPAPAPPTGAEILSESRQHRMRIADLEGDLAEEKAAKAALAVRVTALTGDVALARRERDGWRAKYQRRDGR